MTPAERHRLRHRQVIRSEWVKFRTLRSSWAVLGATVVFVIGLGAAFAGFTAQHWPHESFFDRLTFDPTRTSLGGVFLAQLSIGVLGVLFVTGEYATGLVRATFAVVPKRLPVLAAKLLVFTVMSALVLIPSCFCAFLIGQQFLKTQHIQTALDAPHVTRAVLGAGLYLVAVGAFGAALGWLVRHTAGAIATLFGLVLVLPILVRFLPSQWADDIGTWLPSNAGEAVFSVPPSRLTALGPWAGYSVLCAWVVVALVAAGVFLARRDV